MLPPRARPPLPPARAGLDSTLTAEAGDGGACSFVKSIFNIAIEERTTCGICAHVEKPRSYGTWAEYVWARDLIDSVDPVSGTEPARSARVRAALRPARARARSRPAAPRHPPLARSPARPRRAAARLRPFSLVLRDLVGEYPGRCQNDKCEKAVRTFKHLCSHSAVYSLAMAHESDNVPADDLHRTLAAVEPEIDLTLVYARDDEGAPEPGPRRAFLRHISAFAFAHYVAFTWSEMAGSWLLRDDTMCRIVGPTCDHVRARCVANRYQPSLLIYETEREQ